METNPQPVLPFWVCAPGPEQIPDGPAQHELPQSAALKHCPPINCSPLALPTFFSPAGSKAGPPFAGVVEAPVVDPEAGAAEAAGEAAAAAGAAPETKPHPVLPFCVCAPGPEQMPDGPAQHPLPQSAALKHWPPMNC